MFSALKSLLARFPTISYRKSFAKDDLDKRLEPFIGRRNGFFVEAGAHDGVSQSNTLYYERYFNWTGILVEPLPRLSALCRTNRPHCKVEQVALTATVGAPPSKIVEAGLMSTVRGAFSRDTRGYDEQKHLSRAADYLGKSLNDFVEIEVPTKTLSQILMEHGSPEVDLLSLDVEGYEHEALSGLDFECHRPRFILLEVRYGENHDGLLGGHYSKEAVLSFNQYYQDILYSRND